MVARSQHREQQLDVVGGGVERAAGLRIEQALQCPLRRCSSSIFSSIVLSVTSPCTNTGLSWPMRWPRSVACASTAGFHHGS